MSKTLIHALQERRANVWEQAKALLDAAESEKRELTGEEEQTYQRHMADLDAIDTRAKDLAEAEQRAADAEAAFAKLLGSEQVRSVPTSERKLADQLQAVLNGETRGFEIAPEGVVDFRTLTKGTPTAGGNTVKTAFYNRLVEHFIEVSGVMLAGPEVLQTETGETIEIPVTTAHSTGALTPEGSAITPSDPAFAKRSLGAYKYATLIKVSSELLTDKSVDLEGYMARQAGRAIGNAFGVHAVTGTGSNQPSGVVTTASTGKTGTAAVGGAFTADDLIDLFYSVIAPYRASKSCGWMMRDATVAAARKLKDGNGQYLWTPGLAGAPDTILGKPVHTDPNVAAVAAGAKSVVFGDFSQYFVRIAGGLRFERSDHADFDSDLVNFRAIMRADGLTADQTGALKVFTGGAAS